MVAKAEKIY